MGGVGTVPTDPTVLLADADVLIDYRESELAILASPGSTWGVWRSCRRCSMRWRG